MEIPVNDLIAEVKQYPQIYDPGNNDFKIPERKERAWGCIAKNLNQRVDDCKKRWRSLRERYTRELKRLTLLAGTNPSDQSSCSWEWFEVMGFLQDHIRYRRKRKSTKNTFKTFGNVDDSDNDAYNETVWSEIKLECNDPLASSSAPAVSNEEYYLDPYDAVPIITTDTSTRPLNAVRQKRKASVETLSLHSPSITNEADEMFCRSVACSLEKLSRLHNIKAKVDIYKILEQYIELEENPKAGNVR